MAIGRSSTGVYHRVIGASSDCNGRSFRGTGIASIDLIEKAPEAMFCKKCFRRGKAHALHAFTLDKEREELRRKYNG